MGTSTKATHPAKRDATSSAEYLHQVRVGNICVSIFSDGRYTIQRRYFDPDRNANYAHSFRKENFEAIPKALKQAAEWFAQHTPDGDATGAK